MKKVLDCLPLAIFMGAFLLACSLVSLGCKQSHVHYHGGKCDAKCKCDDCKCCPACPKKAALDAPCKDATAWKKGPLPADTYYWGGVVLDGMTSGFYFADFCGDHVRIDGTRHEAVEVVWYNNCLQLPPDRRASATNLERLLVKLTPLPEPELIPPPEPIPPPAIDSDDEDSLAFRCRLFRRHRSRRC